jgi:hypothetical protein
MQMLLTIDRFEGEKAVLKTNDGQTIIWPKNMLPEDSREGTVLEFLIDTDLAIEDKKRKMAKEVLNELLNTEEKK